MDDFGRRWVNLASARLGAEAIACSDDFFAPMCRMIKDESPVFIDGKYDDHGKWMDGWESRRKREPGHDWCVVRLAKPGVLQGLEISTEHFTGNYPPEASIEGCYSKSDDLNTMQWEKLLEKTTLEGNSRYSSRISDTGVYTHVRLNIFPDGGIARLRVYAKPNIDWSQYGPGQLVDIAASLHGGVSLACNDEHFGSIRNLLMPGRGVNMGDGWETRRRREEGNDWVLISLARAGTIRKVIVDTAHFKGNYPESCSIQGMNKQNVVIDTLERRSEDWPVLLPRVKLQADTEHQFTKEIIQLGPITHVRLNIYPDGGVSRLRLLADVSSFEKT
ncbi:MAG: allantoicase [Gammaproteobacteria bacterium]|nr:allantoicase [Gammaproteobacteria bacterium]MCY4219314.1 allantoicase [Gammaproteobacteria bacterium]MCY4276014.1 allantoicase [Gammaproteobacteria bacterium]